MQKLDATLLELMTGGDQKAFAVIYNKYRAEVMNAAMETVNNRKEAEDITQEVFISLWSRRKGLNITNLGGYLITSAKYQGINKAKKMRREENNNQNLATIYDVVFNDDYPKKEKFKELQLMVNELDQKLADIFWQHKINGEKRKDIAARIGKAEATVKKKLKQATDLLKDMATKKKS